MSWNNYLEDNQSRFTSHCKWDAMAGYPAIFTVLSTNTSVVSVGSNHPVDLRAGIDLSLSLSSGVRARASLMIHSIR